MRITYYPRTDIAKINKQDQDKNIIVIFYNKCMKSVDECYYIVFKYSGDLFDKYNSDSEYITSITVNDPDPFLTAKRQIEKLFV